MDPHHADRVRELHREALGLPAGERERFVRQSAGADGALAHDVLSLLDGSGASGAETRQVSGKRIRASSQPSADESVREPSWDEEDPGAPAAFDRGLPERIGPFLVRRLIGEGGMGIVYEAEQQNPKRLVAVKLMRADHWSSDLASRFRREAALLARLEHPGIARVYEAGQSKPWGDSGPELPYLVMELVDGTPLTAHAARRKMSVPERLELLARICDAVQHAHERGVIHRDLKPANVLVDETSRPRVLDFGVGRALDADTHAATMQTGTSQLIGTLPYMSPEQLAGRPSQIGPASDIYALGVIAYELLADRRPLLLAGLPLAEAVRQVEQVEPPRLGSLDPALAGDIEAIVAKALEKEPERRYASAAAMAADLRRHLALEPIHARPPSAIYRATKFVRRNRSVVAAVTGLITVLVAGVVISARLALREARARSAAVEAAQQAERSAYVSELANALGSIKDGDVRAARESLMRAQPELRDWSWRYAVAALDESVAGVDLPTLSRDHEGEMIQRDAATLVLAGVNGLTVVDIGPPARIVRSVPGRFVAASRDGRRALELRDGAWILHDADGAIPPRPAGPAGPGRAVATPDGRWIVSSPDRTLVVDDQGREAFALDVSLANAENVLHVSPDSRWLVANAPRGIVALDLHRPAPPRILGSRGQRAAFTPDSRRLVVVGPDGQTASFHVPSFARAPWTTTAPFPARLDILAPSPRGDVIVSVDRRGATTTFRVEDGSLLRELGSVGYIWHVGAFDPAGTAFLQPETTGRLRAVRLDGTLLGTRSGHAAEIRMLAWLDDRDLVASVDTSGALRIFRAPGAAEARRMAGHGSYVYGAAFSPDGSRIASCAWDSTARLWEASSGKLLQTVRLPREDARATCWMADGQRVATGSGAMVTLWEAETGSVLGHVDAGDAVQALAPAVAAEQVLIGTDAGRLYAWNVANGELSVVFDAGRRGDVRLAVLPSADHAAFSCGGRVSLLDLATGKALWQAAIPGDNIQRIAFDGRGALVVAATIGGHVATWDARNGQGQSRVRVPGEAKILGLAVHPTEPLFVTGTRDGVITTWNLERGEMVARIGAHDDYVYDLGFSRDGERLVSASGDGTVRVWDSKSAAERIAGR